MTANEWLMYAQCNSAVLWCAGETGSGPSSRNASVERGGERQSDTSDSETTDVRRINQQPFSREGRYDPNRWVSVQRLYAVMALILLHKNNQWYDDFWEVCLLSWSYFALWSRLWTHKYMLVPVCFTGSTQWSLAKLCNLRCLLSYRQWMSSIHCVVCWAVVKRL